MFAIQVLTIEIRGAFGRSMSFADSVSFQEYKSFGGIDMGQEKRTEGHKQAVTNTQLKQIQELAETIRYGSITLVFQDGVLIQIDRSEKIRIPKI